MRVALFFVAAVVDITTLGPYWPELIDNSATGACGGGGGGGGGSLSEYLYERWGGLKSRHDEKRGEPAAVPYPGVRPCKRGRRRLYISKCKRGRRRLYISPAGAGRRPCYMLYCTGLLF